MATLWLVATPIGNLGDLAPRAVEVLAAAEVVCCEDTRRTGKLLQHAGIRARRLVVCNEHTEASCADLVLDVLATGGDVAVVSDAGSPGISDPGERLVAAAVERGHEVSSVPGPSAAIMALTISGLPTERFCFEGFLPRKGKEREARLGEIASERRTTVLYEAPHRIERTLTDLREHCGDDRMVVVARELTKLYEEVQRAPLGEIDLGSVRGEYVLVLAGAADTSPAGDDAVRAALRLALDDGARTNDAAADVARRTGRRKREVYELALDLVRERADADADAGASTGGRG